MSSGETRIDAGALDVILSATGGFEGPIPDRCNLGSGVWIGRIPKRLSASIHRACVAPGLDHTSPVFKQRYAFVRDNPPVLESTDAVVWDADDRLYEALALSRLIRPTATGLEYSATVFLKKGEPYRIVPGPTTGPCSQTFVPNSEKSRAWLTPSDTDELRQLLEAFDEARGDLPPRVCRALWNHEHAACSPWIDTGWTIVATALEALVNARKEQDRAAEQFREGVTAIAARVGVAFTVEDARRAYVLRSRLVHGQGFRPRGEKEIPRSLNPADEDLFIRMRDVLRHAIRRCIEDPSFRSQFETDAAIRATFRLG